ncbi:hypothetical protein LTR54_011651 [Friedmanniomyces endolithicus]|uniref:PAS domain-containing protein n=1 Tax=Friedmanniomyces endolithicus TaxID=329885 RepID=A0AAN6JCA3_9PEZI|nr:hypothetical protein LTR82_004822 [Friedmanniomyces endolithicus]KAK0991731.1 hypothetical protein LTR54_011651 [Friedmanniomyces endolithicus]
METTFISIHDLTPNARILYSSDSIIDILGYTPDEVVNRSAWEYFPAEELSFARQYHEKRVQMDKAAVLAYCRVRHRDGGWVGCECCFTIVYDVMIVCTSIYRQGIASQKRAIEAPLVRRLFSSSPADPRYHMLSHISGKFKRDGKHQAHEPRAALFLNRFTRTLTIMYATNGLEEIIGIPADTMRGRSFYYCIAENCLQDAIKCLENAKGNDSIAYLRFWFRDPRIDDQAPPPDDDSDDEMTGTEMSADISEDGGVKLHSQTGGSSPESSNSNAVQSDTNMDLDGSPEDDDDDPDDQPNSRTSSGDSTNAADTHEAIFGHSRRAEESTSSLALSPDRDDTRAPSPPSPAINHDPIELEAVISCTSDGLVVCLRRARPMIPHPTHRPSRPVYENGLFAAPWAAEPMLPPLDTRPGAGFGGAFAPSLGPHGAMRGSPPVKAGKATGVEHDFMTAIREQAIFAWALTGINGRLAEMAQGTARGESMPLGGLPVWGSDPGSGGGNMSGSEGGDGSRGSSRNGWHHGNGQQVGNGSVTPGYMGSRSPEDARSHSAQMFGDPGLSRGGTRVGSAVGGGRVGSTGGYRYATGGMNGGLNGTEKGSGGYCGADGNGLMR